MFILQILPLIMPVHLPELLLLLFFIYLNVFLFVLRSSTSLASIPHLNYCFVCWLPHPFVVPHNILDMMTFLCCHNFLSWRLAHSLLNHTARIKIPSLGLLRTFIGCMYLGKTFFALLTSSINRDHGSIYHIVYKGVLKCLTRRKNPILSYHITKFIIPLSEFLVVFLSSWVASLLRTRKATIVVGQVLDPESTAYTEP